MKEPMKCDNPKVIEADEIRVGPLVITKTADGGAGIWIDQGADKPMVALFACSGQYGIGLYGPEPRKLMPICLSVDITGAPWIQFAEAGESRCLDMEAVKKVC